MSVSVFCTLSVSGSVVVGSCASTTERVAQYTGADQVAGRQPVAPRPFLPIPHTHPHIQAVPASFLARLAALVPPPRYPLVRYHGVLAPHSKWRSAVVPKVPPAAHAHNPLVQAHRRNSKDHRATATPARTSPAPANYPPARSDVMPCVTSC